MEDICEVSQGLVTGCDKVTSNHIETGLVSSNLSDRGIFILREGIDFLYKEGKLHLKIDGDFVMLKEDDSKYLKPNINSTHLTKNKVLPSNEKIIYLGDCLPSELITRYLFQFIGILINRSKITNDTISFDDFENFTERDIKNKYSSAGAVQKIMKRKQWFYPLYERLSVPFEGCKIIVNTKKMDIFSFSNGPAYSSGGGLGGQNYIFLKSINDSSYLKEIEKYTTREDYTIFLSIILNSKLLHKYIIDGEYNQLSTSKIKQLKIIKLDFSDYKSANLYHRLVFLFKNDDGLHLDNLLYKLYDLTYEEVKVIDPDFWLSEAEYAAVEI